MKVVNALRRGLSIGVLSLLVYQPAFALIPEPQSVLYGLVDAGTETVTVKLNGEVLDSYTMGSNPQAGDYYVLRVPLDALDPRAPGFAQIGDRVEIYVDDAASPVALVPIVKRGTVRQLDLISTQGDSDGDGLTNSEELALGTDPNNPDTDGDGLTDSQELALSTDPVDPDGDDDGLSDGDEIAEGTDPAMPDVRLRFQAGLNVVSVPIELTGRTSLDLLTELGDAAVSVTRLDPLTATMETTAMVGGIPEGAEFPLLPGEGYMVRVTEARELTWTGAPSAVAPELRAGTNLVGFASVGSGHSAFTLLEAIGDEHTVACVTRFNETTGRYESAVYFEGAPAGTDFPVARGVGYVISTKVEVPGFSLP